MHYTINKTTLCLYISMIKYALANCYFLTIYIYIYIKYLLLICWYTKYISILI